jgi:hypothetical protein
MRSKRFLPSMMEMLLLAGLICLAGSNDVRAGQFDDTMWNLTGTVQARVGALSQSGPVSGMLTLSADRTYLLHDDSSSGPDEAGAWFEYRGALYLYAQNVLEQIESLETELSSQAGEPVRIVPLRSTGTAKFNSKTGALSIITSAQMVAMLQSSNLTLNISLKAALTGMPAP